MGKPFVSVVVPTFNCGWCIEVSLGSVLNQSFGDFEVIVVDDGSEDSTREKVMQIEDRRVRYVYQNNAGRAAARNTGIEYAVGDWIAFLDADDLWLPGILQQQCAVVRAAPEVAMVYAQVYGFTQRDLATGAPLENLLACKVLGSGSSGIAQCQREFLLASHDVRTSAVLASRSALLQVGGFDPQYRIVEDWDIFMRLTGIGPVWFIAEPLAAYWIGPFRNNLDRARRYRWHEELVGVVEKNVHVLGVVDSDPTFAALVLAVWEWRCALYEYGLDEKDSAKRHAAKALAHRPDWFASYEALLELSNFLYEVFDDPYNEDAIKSNLKAMTADLIEAPAQREALLRKGLARWHAMQAFNAYASGRGWFGIHHALRAAAADRTWLNNRGLWSLGVRSVLPTRQESAPR